MRIIQLAGPEGRRVGMIEDERIRLLRTHASVFDLANFSLTAGVSLTRAVEQDLDIESLNYSEIYAGASGWRVLPAMDHPVEPARCMVSGTGLTHIRSAANRQVMHAAGEQISDSMRMYQ